MIAVERIYHTWDAWECYRAGFYEPKPPAGMTPDEARDEYTKFLRDLPRFRKALQGVITEWINSCEHYLSNERMNRIAWLGQAACCYDTGVSKEFRGGYARLTQTQQKAADETALDALNQWLGNHSQPMLPDLEAAASKTQMDLY